MSGSAIDLDAIKAAGLNSDEHSRRLLAAHEHQQRLEVHRELMEKFIRDNPEVTSLDFEAYGRLAVVEAGL